MSEAIRIVIIGSDTDSTNSITMCVSKEGKNAVIEGAAENLQSGTELIQKRKPVVVILDMSSAGIDPCLRWIEETVHSFPQMSIFAIGEDRSYETVRKFMAAGATEYLLKPVSEIDLSSALQKFARLRALPKPAGSEGGKIYTVFSSKNGVGVTTIAVNLAASIFEITKEPTLIVDLDLIGGDVTTFLKLKPAYTISDAAKYIRRADKGLLSGNITVHESGITVLAEPRELEESISISGEAVGKILGLLKTMYKHIIVDTESNLTQATMAAIDMSDLILLTFILSLPSIKNTQRYLKYLEKDSIRSNKIRLVINRYFEKLEIKIETAENLLHRPIFWCIPNDFKTAMSSLDKGIPLAAYAPHSKLNLSIEDLAMTVTGKKPDIEGTKTKTSPFHKFFRKSV